MAAIILVLQFVTIVSVFDPIWIPHRNIMPSSRWYEMSLEVIVARARGWIANTGAFPDSSHVKILAAGATMMNAELSGKPSATNVSGSAVGMHAYQSVQ